MSPPITLFKTLKGVTPIKAGRRIFVSGLYWQVLPNGQNYMVEARKIARTERERTGKILDVVYLRRHVDVVQAGFVERGARARKGTVSLAAVAADVLGPTFIAAFALPDGRYALTSAIHDAIVPDSDGTYDESEARQRIQELWNALSASVGSSELEVYAPTELWADAKPITITDLLAGTRRLHRLKQRPSFNARNTLAWSVLFVLSAAVVLSLYALWQSHQAELAQEQARLAAAKRASATDALTTEAELARTRPWTQQASVQTFTQQCVQAISSLPITLSGWILLNAQCTSKSTSASFARTEGQTVLDFARAASAWRTQASVQFSSDGDLGTVHWPMRLPPAGDEGLDSMTGRTHRLMTWWQSARVPFQTSLVSSSFAPGYTPPESASDPRLTTPDWKTLRWSISGTPRNPVTLIEGMDATGVRLQEVQLSFGVDGQLTWSLKGELYGQ